MPVSGREAEWLIREKRIDGRLRSLNPAWQIIHGYPGLATSELSYHAVTEFPTTPSTYYALFVSGFIPSLTEAKKAPVNPSNALKQAKHHTRKTATKQAPTLVAVARLPIHENTGRNAQKHHRVTTMVLFSLVK